MADCNWVNRQFCWDERLGIPVPALESDWEDLSLRQQQDVLARWELVRGDIPEQIVRLEARIKRMQEQMSLEDDFAACCRLNADIAELASRINDLNIWFRVRQDLDTENKRHA